MDRRFQTLDAASPLLGICLLLGACGFPEEDTAAPVVERDPAPTVVLITVDSLNTRLLFDNDWGWDTSPNLEALWEDSVLFTNALSPRGVTRPALSTVITGVYPRDHDVRANSDMPSRTMLHERFQAAGYHTFGYSANQCPLLDLGIDDRLCTWESNPDGDGGSGSLQNRDQMLVDDLVENLSLVDSDENIYVWLHLNHVHRPYEMVPEYYSGYHPDPYSGDLDPSDQDMLTDITLGKADYSEADREHLEAIYASQIRDTDERIQSLLQVLKDLDRYDEAVVVFGIDHGDELAEHNDYFWHGCSPYGAVLDVAYSFYAPGRIRGEPGINEGWISLADVAPTIAHLADAFPVGDLVGGHSVAPFLHSGGEPASPVYFERGTQAAGVVADNYKYLLAGSTEFHSCEPYSAYDDYAYLTELEELYDLVADPEELNNLAVDQPDVLLSMKDTLCTWVLKTDWQNESQDADNPMVQACVTFSQGDS